MKFEKAMVTIINLEGSDVLTDSTDVGPTGCQDAGQQYGDSCETGGFQHQGGCTNKGNQKQWN